MHKFYSLSTGYSGWAIADNTPVIFSRYRHQSQQVIPQSGGDVNKIFNYVNVKEGRVLFLAWLVSCFVPDIPHVMPIFYGEKGAAKSTACSLLKSLIDPSASETMTLQNDPRTLVINLNQHWFLPFDNVSFINEETSDTLCRAITGGGIQQRKLHTNTDDVIFTFKRCLAINGINNVATRPDLLDRAILIELERIAESDRREAAVIQSAFEADRPAILGGIFDTLAKAMSIFPTVKLDRLPRMADFTRWGYAIAEAMGEGLGQTFLDEYTANREGQNEEAIAADPVATLIVEFMKERQIWEGSVSDLLKKIKAIAFNAGISTSERGFPSQPNQLSRRLRGIKSNLEAVGLVYESRREKQNTRLSLNNRKTSTSSPPSTPAPKILAFSGVDNENSSTP